MKQSVVLKKLVYFPDNGVVAVGRRKGYGAFSSGKIDLFQRAMLHSLDHAHLAGGEQCQCEIAGYRRIRRPRKAARVSWYHGW